MFFKLRQTFEGTGGIFKTVNGTEFRASQYNHETDNYVKKKLSERWNTMQDGSKIQRDLYSAFLLKNSNDSLDKPIREECTKEYDSFKHKHDKLVEQIRVSKTKVINSGIRV